MNETIRSYIQAIRSDKQRRHKAYLWLGLLSLAVVCIVVWQLCVPAITMTQNLVCGKADHTHSSQCYALKCENTDPEHTHADECYVLSCDIQEHTHDAECYEVSLEDEKKDWTIAASFVESKVSEDGNSIEWISKDSESWNAGPKPVANEDGKIIVDNWYDYSTTKSKENGNNKTVTVRVSYEYTGDINHFDARELRIDIPNLAKGCQSTKFFISSISLNSSSLFKFSDGSSVMKCYCHNFTYDGEWQWGEDKLSRIDTLSFYNDRDIDTVKELKGYFDITYELHSNGESSYSACERCRNGVFADECEHHYQKTIESITLLRNAQASGSDDEYGFIGSYNAGSGNGLDFKFERTYIHPCSRTGVDLTKHGEAASLSNYAKKQLEADGSVNADEYVWAKWVITAVEYSTYHKPANDNKEQMSLNDHNYYHLDAKGVPFRYHITEYGFNMPYTTKQMQEFLPEGAVACTSMGVKLDGEIDANGKQVVNLPGSMAEAFHERYGFWSRFKYVLYIGYPRSETMLDENGKEIPKYLNQIVENTVKYKIIGANGKDYSETAKNEVYLEDKGGTGGGELVLSYSKEARDAETSFNRLFENLGTVMWWSIPIELDNAPKGGVDIVISDKDFGLKKNEYDHEIIPLDENECRVRTIGIPPILDEQGNRVHAKVTLKLTFRDGKTSTVSYYNEEKNPDGLDTSLLYYYRCWEYKDAPKSFELSISELYDPAVPFQLRISNHLIPAESLINKLVDFGCTLSSKSVLYMTNSAKISVYNHDNPEISYTPGIADESEYLTEPTSNGWAFWEQDQAASGTQTNYRRLFANAKVSTFPQFIKSAAVTNTCTDNFVDSSDDYYYNTYTMKYLLKSGVYTDIYKMSALEDLWDSCITPIENGELTNKKTVFQRFAMYDLLPEGTELVAEAEQMQKAAVVRFYDKFYYKVLNAFDKRELSRAEVEALLKNNLTVTVTNDYKGSGRTLVVAEVNLPDKDALLIINNRFDDLSNGQPLSIEVPVRWRVSFDTILKKNYQNDGITNVVTGVIPDECGGDFSANKNRWVQGELYYDEFAEAGYTMWYVVSHTCKMSAPAAMTQGILDQVRTSTLSTYLPDDASEARRTDVNADYGYQVRLAILSSRITNVKFTDELECSKGDSEYRADEWSGKLSYIDMSNFAGSLGSEAPTAVFTDDESGVETQLVWNEDSLRFTPPDGQELGSGTLTIDLRNAILSPEKYYSYYIHLTAPDEHKDGLTSNKASVAYQKLNSETVDSEIFSLFGNRVFVKLGYPLDKTGVQVEKVWNVPDDDEVTLPAKISFELLRDGKVYKTGTLSAATQWKTVFADLPVYNQETGEKYVYTVKEDAIEGYTSAVELLDEPNADGYAVWRITNTLIGRNYALKIVKTDDKANRLAGAEFELRDSNGNAIAKGTTDSAGELVLYEKLKVGETYKLAETQTPNGYRPLSGEEITFTVNATGEPLSIGHNENDKVSSAWETEGETLVITVENQIQYELPESGGIGDYPFVIGGLLLMAAPLVYIYVRRKERRSEN